METNDVGRPAHIPRVMVYHDAPAEPVRNYVRSASTLLLVQVLIAGAAVAVTGWAAFQVAPLLEKKNQLEVEITQSRQNLVSLSNETEQLRGEQTRLQATLANARQAADYVSRAITQYHNRNYDEAVRIYDQALALDPENPYVLDLKSYSQFRAGDVNGAIQSVTDALEFRPDYIYGYSELSRYACAAGNFDLALDAFERAKTKSPDAQLLYQQLFRDDGQFDRLCLPLRDSMAPRPAAPSPGVVVPN